MDTCFWRHVYILLNIRVQSSAEFINFNELFPPLIKILRIYYFPDRTDAFLHTLPTPVYSCGPISESINNK